MLEPVGVSECGPVRKSNEDSIFFDSDLRLFIVADGMGGLNRGQEASSRATKLFVECCMQSSVVISSHLADCMCSANKALFEEGEVKRSRAGTTLTAAYCDNNICHYAHVGDSRLYHFEAKRKVLIQKTQDHSLSTEMESSGVPQSVTHNFRHILTRSLGTSATIVSDVGSFTMSDGDLLLLCTDGFWQTIDNQSIEKTFSSVADLTGIRNSLRNLALKRNPEDNFSFVLVRYTRE